MISKNMTMPAAAAPRILNWLLALAAGVILAMGAMQAARAQGAGTPEALIQQVTGEVLAAIKADPSV